MAYVLGFWYADGYMRHDKSYRVVFSSKDSEHLTEIAHILPSTSPIEHIRDSYSLLVVRSKKLYIDLLNLGGTPNKSKTLRFPAIPRFYIRDFIRGYFDGDGSVHKITYKASKNGKQYTEFRSNFTCGTRSFLVTLEDILHKEVNLQKKVIGQYGINQFKLGYGQKNTLQLLEYMYYDKCQCSLKRKAMYLNMMKLQKISYNEEKHELKRNTKQIHKLL